MIASKKKRKPLWKIVPGSIVKGTGTGYYMCETIPSHPRTIYPKDHKRGYMYLHEVVMENKLGHTIDVDKYEVHHKDEDPSNNSPSNLELVTRSGHSRDHAKKHKFWKKSPENKPKKASIIRVISNFIRVLDS